MTDAELMAKDYNSRDLERKGAATIWGRSWKAELIVSIRDRHERTLTAEKALAERVVAFCGSERGSLSEEQVATLQGWERLAKILDVIEERMMGLALHPTRPRAKGEGFAGAGRPRQVESVEMVEIVPTASVIPNEVGASNLPAK